MAAYSAEVMAARLRTVTIGFSAEPPRDDIALLVLRNEPAYPPATVGHPVATPTKERTA